MARLNHNYHKHNGKLVLSQYYEPLDFFMVAKSATMTE
jgi:hypothetical protein